MIDKIHILIDGKPENLGSINYDVVSIDRRNYVGGNEYALDIDVRYFREKIEPLYNSNQEELLKSGFFQRAHTFSEWINDSELFRKTCLEWFGYSILEPFLNSSKNPNWLVKSIDDVVQEDNKIIISGRVSRN